MDTPPADDEPPAPLPSTSDGGTGGLPSTPPVPADPDLEALHHRLLTGRVASIVVDENYRIAHLTERANRFLQASGEPAHNLLEKVSPALQTELRSALYRVFQKGEDTERVVPCSLPDRSAARVQLGVYPVDDPEADGTLAQVLIEESAPPAPRADTGDGSPDASASPSAREEDLAEELQETRAQLRTTVEQHEATAEEMETANEELMSMNEELQAKNEELQTSKEQLQSVNEELRSAYQEVEAKVEALNRANSDLENLMVATDVGVLFLDPELKVRRFTPPITDIFRLKDADVGRPITDFTPQLACDSLVEHIEHVLETGDSRKQEISGEGEVWYLLRLRPYRTVDGEIDGVVLTFIDITAQKRSNRKLREERDLIAGLIDTAGALIVVLERDGSIVRFNTASERLTGYPASVAAGEDVHDLLVASGDRDVVSDRIDALAEGRTDRADFEMHWSPKEGEPRLVSASLTALRDEDGTARRFILTGSDITDLRELEREVVEISEQERLRIGKDLHDVISSGLTAAMMQIQSLVHRLEHEGAAVEPDDLRPISAKVQEAGNQIRSLSHALVPKALREETLPVALANLAEEEADFSEIGCEYVGTLDTVELADETTAVNLYRIAHEAVANAREHADASHICIDLREEDSTLVLTVRDDGDGWEGDGPDEEGLGLYLMRHRSNLIGAALTLSHRDGETIVECRLPLE